MPEPTPPKAGGLWGRLFGVEPAATPQKEAPTETPPPLAEPVAAVAVEALALPVAEATPLPQAEPASLPPGPTASEPPPLATPVIAEPLPLPEAPPPQELCPICQTPRCDGQTYCGDCGWTFSDNGPRLFAPAAGDASVTPLPAASVPPPQVAPAMTRFQGRLNDRYEVLELVNERSGTSRYRALDHGVEMPTPVIIIACPLPEMVEPLEDMPVALVEEGSDEILPTFDEVPVASVAVAPTAEIIPAWPGPAWEKDILEKACHPALPAIRDYFIHENCEYLVEELPQGRSLWDAWDEPNADAAIRYGWLIQLAEALRALHQAGAILEGIRPDLVTVSPAGQACLADLADLLPLPLPSQPPLRANLYTAPELILAPQEATAQASLYSFGAMIYALEYLHHDLEEKDFERQFTPMQITERYPDVHPLFFRLINKTFVRDPHTRFPTDEAHKSDPTGFTELIHALDVCRRCFDNVRLDIAAWTTTGMVRTGNEDAFGLVHTMDARQDDLYEYALVLLCDGMGGYEAGEVAAAMTITELRQFLLQQPLLAPLSGKEPPPAIPFAEAACKQLLDAALKEANKKVYTAARAPGRGRRGMGCTAEAVYVDSRHVVVGHVGDSRTYHLHQGRLQQLTRDQTLVNRLVELGQLTAEEAENHPRKNELQQAIGGQPEVFPGVYANRLTRGDWVIVCSDGVTNHISSVDLEKMLTRETSSSAEEAARRLINLCNLRGATDNATLVVIRAS